MEEIVARSGRKPRVGNINTRFQRSGEKFDAQIIALISNKPAVIDAG